MKNSTSHALLLAGIALCASAGAYADDGEPCTLATIKGRYGIQMQGTRPSAPGGPMETVIGVVTRYYDGKGGVTQFDNIKGSISGYVPDRFGVGTYRMLEDCSLVIDFQPAPGLFLTERAVVVDNGREIRTITVSPPPVMVTATHIRM